MIMLLEDKFPIGIRLDGEMLSRLDKIRRREADIPSRSEMVRRLIARAMLRAEADYE